MTPTPASCFKSRRFFLVLHFVSSILLFIPNGLGWYFGNLAVYLNSYSYAKLETANFLSQWVLSIFLVSRAITLLLIGDKITKIDRWKCIFIGVVIFDSGVFLSSFTVQYSQVAFVISYGVLTGIGYGFLQGELLTRLPILFRDSVGLPLAFIYNAMNIGAALYDLVITWYANGRNLVADTSVGDRYMVFDEKSVIDRVPSLFIVLGIVTSLFHFSGFILSAVLKDKGAPEERAIDDNAVITKNSPKQQQESTSLTQDAKCVRGTREEYDSVSNGGIVLSSDSSIEVEKGRVNTNRKCPGQTERRADPEDLKKPTEAVSNNSSSTNDDLNQLQLIKTIQFYIVWFAFFASDALYVVLLNFYKVFAELWIKDDHFLTQLAMSFLAIVTITRMMWALMMGKLGLKNTLIVLTASIAVIGAFYCFAPRIDRWLFAVMTGAMATLSSAVYVVFPELTLKLFGQTHFAANYGMMITSTIILNLIAPQAATSLVDRFGWASVFLATSATNVLALIAMVVGLRDPQKARLK